MRSESASFIWQPKVWTNTFPAGAAAGAGAGSLRVRETRIRHGGGS